MVPDPISVSHFCVTRQISPWHFRHGPAMFCWWRAYAAIIGCRQCEKPPHAVKRSVDDFQLVTFATNLQLL